MTFGFVSTVSSGTVALVVLYGLTQVLYFISLLTIGYFYTRPVDLVKNHEISVNTEHPRILLLYPVLRENEETMRTTFLAIGKIKYPKDRYRIVSIPNWDDYDTIESLERLMVEFSWLEMLVVPPTSDSTWGVVWDKWSETPNAYWWHEGGRAHQRDLPPKKTRQLVYAFYNLCASNGEEILVSYIDADSVPPENYFALAAAGSKDYDVVQLTNVAGNLLTTWASTFHAFDHICWDATMYPHMTAHGKHPYYVLGKGLFFRSSDLHALGGFHPWITIEDPEVGMRFWTNGRRLGVVREPLIEEVPNTFRDGVTQRKRWICGFFQTLGQPLSQMGMTLSQRLRARLTIILNLSFLINPLGLALAIWVLVLISSGKRPIDLPLEIISTINLSGLVSVLLYNWGRALFVSKSVLGDWRSRFRYFWRVNPIFVLLYWLFWTISVVIGLNMYLRGKGLVWERTRKVDANHELVRSLQVQEN